MVNEKLVRRVEELEKINDETSLKIKEIRDAETGSKNEFIKYSNKL